MSSEYNERLKDAARQGNLAEIQRLVALGGEVNMKESQSPLVQASSGGHLECVRWLLDNGAEINLQHKNLATAIYCAAHYGRLEVARLLMERGADPSIPYDGKTALQGARSEGKTAVAQFLAQNPDQVSFSWPLDNRVMQEIYNFPRRERVTLLRKEEGGTVEAMQRESFAALDDQSSLRKAFAEHKRMGGKLEESDVFQGVLAKPKGRLQL